MIPRPLARKVSLLPGSSAAASWGKRGASRPGLRVQATSKPPSVAPGSRDAAVRRKLEAMLPLAAADQTVSGSLAPLDHHAAAPGRPGGEAPQQPHLHPTAPTTNAAVNSEHHHHDHGPLTVLFNQVLGKLGIELSDRARGLICLNLLVLLFASNWVVIKDSEANFDPFVFSTLRFSVAAAAFSPFLRAASEDKRVVAAGVELGIWTAAGYLLQSYGLLTTDASRASFLSTFTVIIVPILAGLSGRGVQPLTWFSAVAALFGVSLLEGGGSPPCLGDVWSFISALAFGVQVFRTEHWARTLGAKRALPLMSVVLAVTMACSMGVAVAAHPDAALDLLEHPWLLQRLFQEGGQFQVPWTAALYTGLMTTDVCLLLEIVALRDVSSTEAAIVYALEPVLGAMFAYLLLGERWGPLGWAGAALIILSSLVTQLYGHEAGEPLVESASESDVE